METYVNAFFLMTVIQNNFDMFSANQISIIKNVCNLPLK